MLQPQPDIDLVEQVDSHAGVLRRAAVLQPDLVLLDLDAGRDDQVVTDLRKACSAKVLVLSGEPDLADDPLAMQADGFVSKTTGSAAIMRELASAAAEHRRTER
jgi:DNA-binding NarL/FixJ family response regulator